MKRLGALTAVLLLAAGFNAAVPSIAGAEGCSGSADAFDQTTTATGTCPNLSGESPGRQPSASSPADRAALFTRFCPGLEDGVAEEWGNSDRPIFIRLDPPEASQQTVQALGYDETGVYHRYAANCNTVTPILLFEVTAPVDPTVLRDRAMASITVGDPQVGMSPPGTQEHFSVVQEETWLWVANDWTTQTAVERQGFVAVEVQVRPSHVTWEMGDAHARWNDGGSVDCTGPGTPYSDQAYPRGTDCGYTYRTSTASEPDQTYNGTATVHWEASWAINGADQGVFTTLTPSATFEQAVGEIQAVIVDEPCNC